MAFMDSCETELLRTMFATCLTALTQADDHNANENYSNADEVHQIDLLIENQRRFNDDDEITQRENWVGERKRRARNHAEPKDCAADETDKAQPDERIQNDVRQRGDNRGRSEFKTAD